MRTRRILTRAAIGLAVALLVGAIVVVGGSYLDHRRLVELEKELYPAPGTLVSVGAEAGPDHLLHVYAEGAGDPTLIFLSGFGTSAPFFDFKPLFTKLSEDYRIAVVDRAGYGWSDITSRPRNLQTVLEDTRTALQRAGEAPPYVLFPHSLAGLEATYWAQQYPDEVEAIIGLDPLVPGYHEATGEDASLSPLITFLARTGMMRSGPDVFARNFPAMVEGRLTEEEAAAAESIFMRRTNTPDMWAEARALAGNAALVREGGPPGVPFHAFVSNEQPQAWTDAIAAYTRQTGGDYHVLDAGHYLHVQKPGVIAEESEAIIEDVAGS